MPKLFKCNLSHMRIKLIIAFIILCFNINAQVNDLEGRTYKTVQIGSQTWMAENLDVDRFKNGDIIPEAKSEQQWKFACENYQPAWCYYNNDLKNANNYGKLYNFWAVIDARGIAPNGWKVPSDDDFNTLKSSVGTYKLSEVELGAKPIYKTEATYNKIPSHPEEKYVSCSNCSYWTTEQKKYTPCSKCKNKGHYYVKTGKTIPEKTEKIEKKILIKGYENGTDQYGFNLQTSGKRYENGFSGAEMYSRSAYLWTTDFNSKNDEFGKALSIGASAYADRNVIMGYSIRCLKGELPQISTLGKDELRNFEFATLSKQYESYYSESKIENIDQCMEEIINSQTDLEFIFIKTEFTCDELDYTYTGIDGKDDIIGFKITKQISENTKKIFLSYTAASTSQYNREINNYGPVELQKISDLLYKTIDNKYLVFFQFSQINCSFIDDPKSNLHLKVIGFFNGGYEKKLNAYPLSWMDNIGGAHWSKGGSSLSGHNQNWALEQVLAYFNPNQNEVKSIPEKTKNPFGDGVTGGGEGGGNGLFDGIGSKFDTIGDGTYRIRINDPVLPRYNTDVDIKVHLKLTVDGEGNVVNAVCVKSKSTTTDQTIINDLIRQVIRQVKYKKDPEGKAAYCYLTVKVNVQ